MVPSLEGAAVAMLLLELVLLAKQREQQLLPLGVAGTSLVGKDVKMLVLLVHAVPAIVSLVAPERPRVTMLRAPDASLH
jgi:hypothetical protein